MHSALLRLFTKKFASCSMSWAGAKGNKEFTLKTSNVWELLNDVVSAKFPDFQKNMGVHFNKFHKDVGKEATRSGISGCGRSAGGDGDRPHAAAGGVGVDIVTNQPCLPTLVTTCLKAVLKRWRRTNNRFLMSSQRMCYKLCNSRAHSAFGEFLCK